MVQEGIRADSEARQVEDLEVRHREVRQWEGHLVCNHRTRLDDEWHWGNLRASAMRKSSARKQKLVLYNQTRYRAVYVCCKRYNNDFDFPRCMHP